MPVLEERVGELKQAIFENDGENVADYAFARAVDELIGVFYDDIGEVTNVSIRSLFDLFVIKVLYVGRRSRDASVIDYLGEMLARYLFTRELYPIVRNQRQFVFYLSDLMEETKKPTHFQNLFEAYRKYADNALFITGVFPRSLNRRRPSRRSVVVPSVDRNYYVSTGKTYYHLAAEHELAGLVQQRDTLNRLAAYFEIYSDALNEMSERYILGLDMNLIADKMLDSFNLYRKTGEQQHLENA